MASNLRKVLLLPWLLFVTATVRGDDLKQSAEVPKSLNAALGCLVGRGFVKDNLKDLKLRPGAPAWVRYHVGSIPAMPATPGEFYIAVYSEDDLHGWLLLSFKNEKGEFVSVRNAYRLTKDGSRWNADEGNGGLATYRAMSRFATEFAKSPRYRVKLVPQTQGCAPPDEY